MTFGPSFIIRPNRSLSRRGVWLFFAVCSVGCALVASAFAVLGAWPVLPFAGLEVALLGAALYLFYRDGQTVEVISVQGGELSVTRTDWRGTREWRFPLAWVQVLLRRDPRGWYPSRLYLRSHGRAVRIGDFLTEVERERLAGELSDLTKRAL